MNAVPIITGDRYDGLKESLDSKESNTDFLFVQTQILAMLQSMMNAMQKVWQTMSFTSLELDELVGIALFFGIVSLFQVYLALT